MVKLERKKGGNAKKKTHVQSIMRFLVPKVKKKATKMTIINNIDESNSANNAESNTDSNNAVPINVPTTIITNNDRKSRLVHV